MDDQTIRDLTEAIRSNPNGLAYNNRGLAYYQKGECDKAIADFSEAIELDPEDPETYYNRAKAYSKKEVYD